MATLNRRTIIWALVGTALNCDKYARKAYKLDRPGDMQYFNRSRREAEDGLRAIGFKSHIPYLSPRYMSLEAELGQCEPWLSVEPAE